VDDIYTIDHRRLPRSPSPSVHFRYRHSLQYPRIGDLFTLYSPRSSPTPSRGQLITNSSATPSVAPSQGPSNDYTTCPPPSLTSITTRGFSRLQAPLPALPQSPSEGDITSLLPSPPKLSAPLNTPVQMHHSVWNPGSTPPNEIPEVTQISSPLDQRIFEERGGLIEYPKGAIFEEAYDRVNARKEDNEGRL
jgi:hypothetical protein